MSGKKNVEQLNYEEAFEELGSVVEALESNQRPLDEAVALFERGQSLALHCAALLDKAELKVQTLTALRGEEPEEGE
jgi:exodeoxyribonuclease VII small subunit